MTEQQVVDEIRTELDGRPVSERPGGPMTKMSAEQASVYHEPGLPEYEGPVDAGYAQAVLYAALAKAQAEFPPIPRDRTVRVQPRDQSKRPYTFAYAPLDTIIEKVRPALAANGLAVTQLLSTADGHTSLRTQLLHAGGGMLESVWPLSPGGSPQEFGSALTYLRRYTLVALLGVASEEDDDGNHASGNQATPQNTAQEARRDSQTASGGSDGPAPAGNGRTAPVASKQQLNFISGLMGELAEAGVADKDDLKAYARKEYGVAELENLTGGRNGQASELISRLQVRLAGHLLAGLQNDEAVALLDEHGGGATDIAQVEAGALAGLIAAAKKAGQA